jgi:prepilin-type N-terminal cleavage/methylation domain-containing protein
MRHYRAFSLIELVIVVVIIGIISSIAIPRLSQGSQGAIESKLRQDLGVLRTAIDMYQTEHCGLLPTDGSTIIDQLTMCTDMHGNVSATMTSTHIYGPYLSKMPSVPVGKNKGSSEITDKGVPGSGNEGWFYDKSMGGICANAKAGEVDSKGVAYSSY